MCTPSYGKKSYGGRRTSHRPVKLTLSATILLIVSLFTIYGFCVGLNRQHNNDYVIKSSAATGEYYDTGMGSKRSTAMDSESSSGPTIHSLDGLSLDELHPKASSHRYIVSPPADDKPISLVTCETTVGYLHIVVQ